MRKSSQKWRVRRSAVGSIVAWSGVFISAPAKSTPSRIEHYPREFVFGPYRGFRGKVLRIIERCYCHVDPFRTDFVLNKQRRPQQEANDRIRSAYETLRTSPLRTSIALLGTLHQVTYGAALARGQSSQWQSLPCFGLTFDDNGRLRINTRPRLCQPYA